MMKWKRVRDQVEVFQREFWLFLVLVLVLHRSGMMEVVMGRKRWFVPFLMEVFAFGVVYGRKRKEVAVAEGGRAVEDSFGSGCVMESRDR